MLAPFFTNLLMWCLALLFAGWAFDVINGWFDSVRRSVSHSNRPVPGPARGSRRTYPFAPVAKCRETHFFSRG